MTIREKQEQWEAQYLSPYAALSKNSRGRDRYEPQCDIRPVYQRDRDRILHSKSFRRLKHTLLRPKRQNKNGHTEGENPPCVRMYMGE